MGREIPSHLLPQLREVVELLDGFLVQDDWRRHLATAGVDAGRMMTHAIAPGHSRFRLMQPQPVRNE